MQSCKGAFSVLVFASLACTPSTDLQNEQASSPSAETTTGGGVGSSSSPLPGALIDPPVGSVGIATNISSLIVQFSEAVRAAGPAAPFVLRRAGGSDLPLSLGVTLASTASCTGACYLLSVPGPLAPVTLETLAVVPDALQFLDGKPLPAGSLGTFTTAEAADLFSPRVTAFTVQLAEGCLTAHLAADEPVRAQITLSVGDSQAIFVQDIAGATLDFTQRLPELPASASGQALASVADRSGNTTLSSPFAVDLPPLLPHLVITEVLANPAGSENTQEFVELSNVGTEPAELGGLVLADKSGSDVLPAGTLAAGGFALVVAENYNPTDGNDPAPRDGTLVLRVGGRLGGDGLANTGEPVYLRAADGFVVSQYGGWVNVSATAWSGKSVKRVSTDACDSAGAWSKVPSSPTPGW